MACSRGTILMTGGDPDSDAERLKSAMDGSGTNDKAIVDILGHRTNAQRQQIKESFLKLYGKDLEQALKDELDGEFENLIVAMLTETSEYDAECLMKATKGWLGADDDLIIEILGTRTQVEMQKIKEAHFKKYDDSVTRILEDDLSGDFWKLCAKLLERGGCHETGSGDRGTARLDAIRLYEHGEGRIGRDEDVFIDMFTTRSYAHLRLVFNEYEKATDRTVEEAIESQFSGDMKMGLLTLVECVRNTPRYFAKKLHKSLTEGQMMGLMADHDTTIRIAVSRAEIDLDDIKVEFMKLYRKTLSNCVEEEIRGPYRRMLLEIIRY